MTEDKTKEFVFHKYTKIKQLGDEENKYIFSNPDDIIVIEEKVDGANFRFFIHKDNYLVFGSHGRELSEGEHTEKAWRKCIEFIKSKLNNESVLINSEYKNKIFYGECMIKHSLDYDWERIPAILMFDILDTITGKFIDNKNAIFDDLNLPKIPFIKTCFAGKIGNIDDSAVPDSVYTPIHAEDKKAEGIVFKNYKTQIFAKYVRAKFKEVNKQAFGGHKKFANNDDELVVATYCTNARIDKCIFKLSDEGMQLSKIMMTKLPMMVWNDIIEENYKDIFNTRYRIDLGEIKKLIAKRCLAVLDQVITNNAIYNGDVK